MSDNGVEKTISQVIIELENGDLIPANIVLPLSQVVTNLNSNEKEGLDSILSWGTFGGNKSNS